MKSFALLLALCWLGCLPATFNQVLLSRIDQKSTMEVVKQLGQPDKKIEEHGKEIWVYWEKPDPIFEDFKVLAEAASGQRKSFKELGMDKEAKDMKKIERLAELAKWIPHSGEGRALKLWISNGYVESYQIVGEK